ncbi:unnamed protein product, partial [Effrenium voratum]
MSQGSDQEHEDPSMETFDESQSANREAQIREVMEQCGLDVFSSVNDLAFGEADFPSHIAKDVQDCWTLWVEQSSSRDAAGEVFFTALFDAAPSLQTM